MAWVPGLGQALAVPSLGEYGVQESHFPDIVAKSQRSSSTKGNPIELTAEELTAILQQAV